MRALTTLSVAALAFALAFPVIAREYPHYPAGVEQSTGDPQVITKAPAEKPGTFPPSDQPKPMMACADMMSMISAMKSVQTMQMEMKEQMREMHQTMAVSPGSGGEKSP